MTKVSYYILDETAIAARTRFAVKFVRQSYRKGLDIHCHVATERRLELGATCDAAASMSIDEASVISLACQGFWRVYQHSHRRIIAVRLLDSDLFLRALRIGVKQLLL